MQINTRARTTFTYTHVIQKTTNVSPTMFGPIFVHTEKSYESYYYFFSTLLKLEPRLARIIAVVTDGELAITKATKAVFGESDAMCVASSSGDKPHVVSKTSKGNLTCDDACLAWKCRRFCSHVLAVAEELICLNEFLSNYKFLKISGNYTAVCMHNQP